MKARSKIPIFRKCMKSSICQTSSQVTSMSSLDPTRIRRQKLYDFLYSLFKIFNRDFFSLFAGYFLQKERYGGHTSPEQFFADLGKKMEEVSKFFHREILLLKSRKLRKKKSKSEVERKTREVWVESRRVQRTERPESNLRPSQLSTQCFFH